MKKVTKKQIVEVLKTGNRTAIFQIAKMTGLDVSKRHLVFEFIKEYAITEKVKRQAYNIAYNGSHLKVLYRSKSRKSRNYTDLQRVVDFAKKQKEEGFSNYSKRLIEGHSNIYWASPYYGHRDYNKGIAFENTEKNRRAMTTINNFLKF